MQSRQQQPQQKITVANGVVPAAGPCSSPGPGMKPLQGLFQEGFLLFITPGTWTDTDEGNVTGRHAHMALGCYGR